MFRKALALGTLALLAATTLLAQSAEYGRASGGEIEGIVKRPSTFSGSLGLNFGTGSSRGFLGSVGGTVIKDKMWFFASSETNRTPATVPNAIGTVPTLTFGDMTARINDSQMFKMTASRNASFSAIPSSFLSLHYTGIVSPSMFFTATVSKDSSSIR